MSSSFHNDIQLLSDLHKIQFTWASYKTVYRALIFLCRNYMKIMMSPLKWFTDYYQWLGFSAFLSNFLQGNQFTLRYRLQSVLEKTYSISTPCHFSFFHTQLKSRQSCTEQKLTFYLSVLSNLHLFVSYFILASSITAKISIKASPSFFFTFDC